MSGRFLPRFAGAMLVALAATACKQSSMSGGTVAGPAAEVKTGYSSEQLHQMVIELASRFGLELRRASKDIEDQSTERMGRRRAVSWKIVTAGYIEESSFQGDPRVALIDLWVLAHQMRAYFASDNGREVFGTRTPLAVEACDNMIGEAESVARTIIHPESLEKATKTVAEFATAHPMGESFSRESPRAYSIRKGSGDPMGDVFDTALMPLRAIGGMDETALAIHHAATVVTDAVQVARMLPERIHWQTQLLVYDLEDLQTTSETREAMSKLSNSSESLAKTAQELPQVLQQQVAKTLAEIDERQSNLQTTLREARQTLETGDKTIVDAHAAMDGLTTASVALEGTLREFRGMIADFQPKEGAPPSESKEPARPFDINEYTRAAESVAKAAAELNAAIVSARQIASPPAGEPAPLEAVGANIRSIANHVALLVVATAAAVLVLVLAYRVVVRRLNDPAGRVPTG